MNIRPILPAGLCVVAGVLLVAIVLKAYFIGGEAPIGGEGRFDTFSFALGVYFVGKGLFIYSILTLLNEFKQSR